jgi:putative transposase
VIPGVPHHVTQRGNGRQQTFFEPGDYALYLDLLAAAATLIVFAIPVIVGA